MGSEPQNDDAGKETEVLWNARLHPLTSEGTSEETLERLRTLPERVARLRKIIDASRETYSR